ncbi:MAG: Xaa-Pro dipeptidase [Silanimonas sp.]|nr:MAG: Xaa-Pro dipeptidase [Silanimonas sp.]
MPDRSRPPARRHSRLAALAALAALPVLATELSVLRAPRVLLDPAEGQVVPATLVVADGRLRAVLPGLEAEVPLGAGERIAEERRFDTEHTLLPGLIDSHVHLAFDPAPPFWAEAVVTPERATALGARNALRTVQAGFTTVRDLGAPGQAGFALRDAIAAGELPGPRVLSAGRMVSIIGGHGDLTGFRPEVMEALDEGNTCTGAVQCAEVVRRLSRAGADVIKFAATGGVLSQQNRGLDQHFTDEEMKAIVDTAHQLGLKVAAHAHGPRGIEAAARAGVDSIEHGTYVDEAGIRAMRGSGSVLVPTLSPTIAYRENLPKGLYTPVVAAKIKLRLEATGRNIAAARRAGLKIAYGTDTGVSEHGRNAEEMPLMVQYGGMSPQEVLVSATRTAAELLGLEDEVGRLAPGFSADVIAVRGDPLTDLGALQRDRVAFVMARGRVVRE